MGGGASGFFKPEKRPKPLEQIKLFSLKTQNELTSSVQTNGTLQGSSGKIAGGETLENKETLLQLFQCDCCGQFTLPNKDRHCICITCGWQDDPDQRKSPILENKSNKMSLLEAQRALSEGRKIN